MANSKWEAEYEAHRFDDEDRLARAQEEYEAGARGDVRHAPAHLDRQDNFVHPCGADALSGTRTAYRTEDIDCPGCLEAEEQLQKRIAASSAANAEWLAAEDAEAARIEADRQQRERQADVSALIDVVGGGR